MDGVEDNHGSRVGVKTVWYCKTDVYRDLITLDFGRGSFGLIKI